MEEKAEEAEAAEARALAEAAEEIKKIREVLLEVNNPLFFFDNDVDGLAAFLIFYKTFGKGKAVAIKSFPELNPSYARKISELKADCIFILDKPRVAKGFFELVEKLNVRVIWIDHHIDNLGFSEKKTSEEQGWIFFNPTLYGINRPTTYWAYQIAGKPKALAWIAALGCLADWFIPEFIDDVYKEHQELFEKKPEKQELKKPEEVGKLLYETTFGKLILLLNFALKDTTTNIIKLVKFLSSINTPSQILEESKKNRQMHKRARQIFKHYEKLLAKAKKLIKPSQDFVWFQYGGSLSISAELSNALLYAWPNKLIVVAYIKDERARISIRSNVKVRDIVLKALEGLEGASGGGHESALGANVRVEDLPAFKEKLARLWRELKKSLAENK
ncbi:MAG: DHHA1 domain-containing protein [Candidatus Pacearchaeota archaeon]